jgi:hypothetical protein
VNPIDFPQKTRVLQKPPSMTDEECSPLAIHDTGAELLSCWQPTDEERAAIAAGAPIWLSVVGRGHPPVALFVESPFALPDPDSPEGRCGACGLERLARGAGADLTAHASAHTCGRSPPTEVSRG